MCMPDAHKVVFSKEEKTGGCADKHVYPTDFYKYRFF
jgi:hypothetical protein